MTVPEGESFETHFGSKKERKMKRAVLIVGLAAALPWVVNSTALSAEKAANPESKVPATVAKVNGKVIKGDFYTRMYKQVEMTQKAQGAPPEAVDPEGIKQQVLDHLINVELLIQKADEKKIQVSAPEIEKVVEQAQARFGGQDQMKDALKAQGLTDEDFRSDVARSLKIQQLLKTEVADKVSVAPGEAKAFYDGNPQAFQVPEQVKARHILIRLPEGASDSQKKEAKQAIQKAADRVKKGESFESVAKAVSQDPGSAPNGGELGFFPKGRMVPEFEKTAFSLEPGKVSAVVETQYGYHLIKVEEKQPAKTLSFQEVEAKVGDYLKRKKGDEGVEAYVNALRASAKIDKTQF
jgi:peptidyl-prolyl cis-trans isomerase C